MCNCLCEHIMNVFLFVVVGLGQFQFLLYLLVGVEWGMICVGDGVRGGGSWTARWVWQRTKGVLAHVWRRKTICCRKNANMLKHSLIAHLLVLVIGAMVMISHRQMGLAQSSPVSAYIETKANWNRTSILRESMYVERDVAFDPSLYKYLCVLLCCEISVQNLTDGICVCLCVCSHPSIHPQWVHGQGVPLSTDTIPQDDHNNSTTTTWIITIIITAASVVQRTGQ